MKHYIKTHFLILVLALFCGSGCSKFLEESDPSNLTPDAFYTIPQHAEAAIAAVYADARFLYNSSNYILLDAPTGTATTENAPSDMINLYSMTYDGSNIYVVQMWNGAYRLIAQTNLLLQKVPDITPMDDIQKKKVLAEAHFLRAWAYFYAVRLWGDIPLITLPQDPSSDEFFAARTPQSQVYDLIVADLLAAEAGGLPWTDVTGRITLAATKTLLAKVYLTMAGQPLNKGQQYFGLSAAKAKEVIDYSNSNPLSVGLFPDYTGLRDATKKNTLENLFSIQYEASIIQNPVQANFLPSSKAMSAYKVVGGYIIPTVDFYKSYEAGDKRVVNQVGYFYESYYADGSGAVFNLGGPYIFKFFDQKAHGSPGNPGTATSSLNMPQVRFSETLLIYAEAQNESGGPNLEAYTALKRIRDRATLTTPAMGTFNQASFREAVWKERWYELCYEGIVWFDMVRLRKAFNTTTKSFENFIGHVNSSSPNQPLQQKHLLFPLPKLEMTNNPNLRPQNPGFE